MSLHPKENKIVNEKEIAYMRKQASYTQRFDLLMKMIRLQRMVTKAAKSKHTS